LFCQFAASNCYRTPLVSGSVIGTAVPHFAPSERDGSSAGETASISSLHRSETAAIWWRGRRFGLRWRWSREVFSGEGGGVGLRRGSRRHRCASTTASSTATHPPQRHILHGSASTTAQHRRWLSIGDGIVHRAAHHRARRSIEDSGRSARQFLRLVVLRREIFTARE
jgi:hypothetical protein